MLTVLIFRTIFFKCSVIIDSNLNEELFSYLRSYDMKMILKSIDVADLIGILIFYTLLV